VITGADATGIGNLKDVVRFPDDPGKAYNAALEKDFDHASLDSQQSFFDSLAGSRTVRINAGPYLATSIARTSDGRINCFFANFTGLIGHSNPTQTPQDGVKVSVVSTSEGKAFFLPFLGDTQPLKGIRYGDEVTFSLPQITRGAVFWYEP